MAGRFARVETRQRTRGFVLGLLADLPRKNCWTIAEHAGDRDPHGMQHLLNRASWDTDGVRDDLRDYVTTGLGDTDAVLVVDETGDRKKGSATVGVQRQYTGTAGRLRTLPRIPGGRGLPHLRRRPRARDDRPRALPPALLDRRPRPAHRRRGARRHRLRHQTGPGRRHAHPAPCAPGFPPGGSPATRSTATTPTCAPSVRPADRLRAGHRPRPARAHRGRTGPR
jgi:DDE superfamily endonuclease